ncbi:MAG: T9SS type A sorting domain-containing protein [Ignavibacteria bacterium]|nr:T9SS type A sorting domain-containing protein [Ignavibacteria bacterium]
MKKILVCCLLVIVSCFSFAQQSKQEKLQQLKTREDIKVTEVEKDILKLEYRNSKTLYKNIGEYQPPTNNSLQKTTYSPTYDSTIIDLTTIDTTLYYQKYSYWQEVPLGNFRTLLVGDVNKNGRPELYGQMKDYWTDYTDIMAFEMDANGKFKSVYKYDSTVIAGNIYDVDKDGMEELRLERNNTYVLPGKSFPFYKKGSATTLATEVSFIFAPNDTLFQQNDNYFGDWDGDSTTDQVFITPTYFINFYEYDPALKNFDSVLVYDHRSVDVYFGGFSIGDFDQDGKTEFLAGSPHGKVLSFENAGNNSYAPNWEGKVETYNAYLCAETNDVDGNGKKEIWIGGDMFYNGLGITRISLFEADGNDSYQVVGKIDILGIFSWDAGNIQVIDVDKDGKEEVLLGLDQTVVILKFNGSKNHQTYELFYFKQNNLENNMGYYGGNLFNLIDDERDELLINMWNIVPNVGIRWFNWIYKPNFVVSVSNEQNIIPKEFSLSPNYPNPFNPQTKVKYEIAVNSIVSINIYNILGKEITTLVEKEQTPGSYQINWEAKDSEGKLLPSGVYLIRLSANGKVVNYTKTVKAILIK